MIVLRPSSHQIFYFLLVASGLFGCASATKQTDALLQSPASLALPASVEIQKVPFIEQSAGHCGPATLAMAMNWSGQNVDVNELAKQVYTPGMKGSLQTDLISASRRRGLMAIPISGLPTLLSEVAAGHPVIVFENLSVSWLPQWHYALVFGFDLRKEEVLMHSGPEAFKRWDLRKFERSWMLGDYWGLVVLPPGQLAESAGELANVTAANGLEQSGHLVEAEKSYDRIKVKWPGSLPALIGLANISFQQKDAKKAAGYLEQATKFHPESAIAWHNLTIAQGGAGRRREALQSAQKALQLAAADQKDVYRQNLKEWLPTASSVPKTN